MIPLDRVFFSPYKTLSIVILITVCGDAVSMYPSSKDYELPGNSDNTSGTHQMVRL